MKALLASSHKILCALQVCTIVQFGAVILLWATGVMNVTPSDVGIAIGALFTFEAIRRILFTHLRVVYLRLVCRLSVSEIRYIDGPRIEAREFGEGARHLKTSDVLFRKGGHVVSLLLLFLFHKHTVEEAFIVALSAGSLLIISAQTVAMGRRASDESWHVLRYLFGASDRIGDGRLAKHNAMTASVAMTLGIVTSYTIGQTTIRAADFGIASEFVILPLTFGDALGEIVGTPFGRHGFNVVGFGEVNRKSVEGCVAVFFGSCIPCLVACTITEVESETWALPFIVATATTFVETVSFRSTDNFTIPFVNSAIVVLWTQFFELTSSE